jgi:hypothetical protein
MNFLLRSSSFEGHARDPRIKSEGNKIRPEGNNIVKPEGNKITPERNKRIGKK